MRAALKIFLMNSAREMQLGTLHNCHREKIARRGRTAIPLQKYRNPSIEDHLQAIMLAVARQCWGL
jgi:hypothetical protein